jgi:hypothetical protein
MGGSGTTFSTVHTRESPAQRRTLAKVRVGGQLTERGRGLRITVLNNADDDE